MSKPKSKKVKAMVPGTKRTSEVEARWPGVTGWRGQAGVGPTLPRAGTAVPPQTPRKQ